MLSKLGHKNAEPSGTAAVPRGGSRWVLPRPPPHLWHPRVTCAKKKKKERKKTQVLVEHDDTFLSLCCRPTAGTPLRPEAVSFVGTE